MSEQIAPCRICGKPPRVIEDARGLIGDHAWRVTCCPSTAIYYTRIEAITAWNDDTRAAALLRAVEGLERRLREDKEDVFHINAALSYKQAGQIRAALVGRVGEQKKHMGAVDEVREPTLVDALIVLGLEARDG